MAKQEDRYENESIDFDLSEMGSVLHGGSAVQQGMRGYSRRTEERGRNEFRGNGGSAELDPGRIHEGGRHYGRPAVTEPAPDGGPPGRPDLGEMGALQPAQLQVIEEEASGAVAFTPDALLQSRHSEALFTSDRAEVESKPPAIADRPRHEVPSRIEVPKPIARDAASPAAAPTRKAAARATPQTARKAAGRRTARSEVSPSEARRPTAKASGEKKPAAKVGAAKKASSLKKAGAKVGAAKKAPAEKAAAKKAPAEKAAAKKAPAKTSAVKKAPAKTSMVKKGSTRASGARKVTAKADAAKKSTAGKATAKKTVR